MKALSIRQPWAELIVSGRRRYEMRTWTIEVPQRIVIHASRTIDEEACARLNIDPAPLHLGGLVGSVRVVACERFTEESWESRRFEHMEWSPFNADMYGWVLQDARRFKEPLTWRGSLGLFDVPDDVLSDSDKTIDSNAGE